METKTFSKHRFAASMIVATALALAGATSTSIAEDPPPAPEPELLPEEIPFELPALPGWVELQAANSAVATVANRLGRLPDTSGLDSGGADAENLTALGAPIAVAAGTLDITLPGAGDALASTMLGHSSRARRDYRSFLGTGAGSEAPKLVEKEGQESPRPSCVSILSPWRLGL